MFGAKVLIKLIAFSLVAGFLRLPVQPTQDLAVYEAVLASKIRSEVNRFSLGAGLKTPAPVLAFDTTLSVCRPASDHPRQIGCIRAEDVQSFETKSARMRSLLFESRLTAASREELGRSFRGRNREGQAFPGDKLNGVLLVRPEELVEVLQREASRTRGFSSFSMPAYSRDGHALVYASYVCGSHCGYGWFFLLRRQGESWQVLDVVMLWSADGVASSLTGRCSRRAAARSA